MTVGFVVVLFLVQAAGVQATAPRTSALGGDSTFFEDDSNVLRWYGSLVDYGGQVLVGTGHHDLAEDGASWSDSKSGFGAGGHFELDSGGKWGTAALYYNEKVRDSDVSTSIEDDPGNSFLVMYGRKIGPMQIGLALQHGADEWDAAIDTTAILPLSSRELSRTTIGVGVRADLSPSSYFDLALDLHRLNWVGPAWNLTKDELKSWNNISFRTRAFFDLGNNFALVPDLEFWSEDYTTLLDQYDMGETHDNKMLRMGCGLNYFPNSDNFILLSADYLGLQDDVTINSSDGFSKRIKQFNVTLATETRFSHWLTLRASAKFQHFKREDQQGTSNDLDDVVFPLSFGAGFHLSGFDLDVAMASHEPGLLNPNWSSLYSDKPSVQAAGSWFSASLRYLF